MSHGYRMVQWTPFKKAFDVALGLGVLGFLAAFIAGSILSAPSGELLHPVQLAIRACGAAAFGLLTLILAIGPLARFSLRLSPLLYNRRHLGVTCFFVALAHAALTLVWYHGFSDLNPLISLLASNPRYDALQGFPFESLGVAALLILLVMAVTSHDFWNALLGPSVWKALHMGVYAAYGLIVAHVLLGALQAEKSLLYPAILGVSAFSLVGLHIAAGLKETRRDATVASNDTEGWLRVGPARDIPDGRAHVVTPLHGERIAVFRDGSKIHALSNVCRHQGGPLGEGRIIDGCVTCPWHGFQYRPEDGCSPPPFTEKVATYRTRIVDGGVFVEPRAEPPGTAVAPAVIEGAAS